MFSLLSPFVLWLTPLLAVPLAIALMGRAHPRTRDFPSLLPVRASLQRAMKRHRLKNRLQLILRTLILLCLLLAAAGLQWRGRPGPEPGSYGGRALKPPARSGLLLHNGVYALAPSSVRDEDEPLLASRMETLRHALDSLARAHQGDFRVEPLFTAGEFLGGMRMASGSGVVGAAASDSRDGRGRAVARFGAPPEAAARLLRSLGTGGGRGEIHAFIPVFAARDLAALAPTARAWLDSNPNARLVLLDHGDAAARLRTFARATAVTDGRAHGPGRGDMMTVRVEADGAQGFVRAPVWRPAPPLSAVPAGGGGSMGARETRGEAGDGAATITMRLPETADGAGWVAGTFAMPDADPAHPEAAVIEHPVAYRIPPPATLCHVGTRAAFVSLASLGESGERLKVRALEPHAPFPTTPTPPGAASASDTHGCDLLYLADPPVMSPALLARAATILRTGGTVILETGPHTDAALWNRNLLAPLSVGRLTTVVSEPAAVRPVTTALQAAGLRSGRWGAPGTVTQRFGFRMDPGGTAWLRADATSEGDGGDRETGADASALLVHRRVGAGRLLLWTTSLSDPAWSDLGLGPWPVLIHQGLFEGAWATGIASREVATDSLAWWPATPETADRPPYVWDPEGHPFPRVRGDAGGWWIGPFDRAGLYRIAAGSGTAGAEAASARDADRRGSAATAWLAVTLAAPPPPPDAGDWEAFRGILGPDAWSRVVRLEEGDDWRSLYEGVNLRFVLLMLAALLLFAEGVLSLRLAHDSRR